TVVNSQDLRTRLDAAEGVRPIAVIRNAVLARGPVVAAPDPVVGMVANFRHPKDHRTFLRAAALIAEKVPTAEFHLVGRGPDEAELRALTDELGLTSRVRF